MVKALSSEDRAFLREAVKQAEAKTSARLCVVVLPTSDSYREYMLAFGLFLGSVLALLLWSLGYVENFLWLLSLQLGVVALCDFTHDKSDLFVHFIPREVKQRNAARACMREYHEHDGQSSIKNEPFVLLFVSLAEHYVHIVTNPVVHRRFPDAWHKITDDFLMSVRKKGFRTTCAETLNGIAETLSTQFPD